MKTNWTSAVTVISEQKVVFNYRRLSLGLVCFNSGWWLFKSSPYLNCLLTKGGLPSHLYSSNPVASRRNAALQLISRILKQRLRKKHNELKLFVKGDEKNANKSKVLHSSEERREDGFTNRPSFLTNFCNTSSLLSGNSLAETSRLIYLNNFQTAIMQTHIKSESLNVIDACLWSAWFLHAKPLVGVPRRAKWMWITD